MRWLAAAVLAIVVAILPKSVMAATIFFSDESAWLAVVSQVEGLDTTRPNIALADEVVAPPPNNAQLGNTLTFDAVNTGLSRSFSIRALQSGASLVFNDEETVGVPSFGENVISVGDANNEENDDWELNILSGPNPTALAFFLVNNDVSLNETLSIFGTGNVLLGTLESPNIPGPLDDSDLTPFFIGVVSDMPIARVHFNEDNTGDHGDDIAISDFRFAQAIPEPSTLVIWSVLGSIGIAFARWRRRRAR